MSLSNQPVPLILPFTDARATEPARAGGKGATLARLVQAGYPVPAGLVIAPEAFGGAEGDTLSDAAWAEVQAALVQLAGGTAVTYAVRSSALAEDSAQASFAGEFESVLDVAAGEPLLAAIHAVRRSRHAGRVQAYSTARGLSSAGELAVLVQVLVRAEYAGVLFTADPLTGSHAEMLGNYVAGLGERLVAGEADPLAFRLKRPYGRYSGPPTIRRYAGTLFRWAERLVTLYGGPQDIEWAVAHGRVWLLQTRPITTMQAYKAATGEWNSSLMGDYLWTNANVGEAIADVMTPFTWSLTQRFMRILFPHDLEAYHPWHGNIGGRFYMNLSILASMGAALGFNGRKIMVPYEDLFGRVPADVSFPVVPIGLGGVAQFFFRIMRSAQKNVARRARGMQAFLVRAPAQCATLRARVADADTSAALLALWPEVHAHFQESAETLRVATSAAGSQGAALRGDLVKWVGEPDANTLMASLSAAQGLSSLDPLLGLERVAAGTLTQADYQARYGHRGPHEFELSHARPGEEPGWVERRLADLRDVPNPPSVLLAQQQARQAEAWARFSARQARRVTATRKRLAEVSLAAHKREATRSELVRALWPVRTWAVRAGELSGLGDDVFFLALEEVLAVLAGTLTLAAVGPRCAVRRATHVRDSALPPYPALISGRFDPAAWAADPARCHDVFDAHGPARAVAVGALRGFAGAAGVVEGVVRVLTSLEEGRALVPGEILVTCTTNVGWTPLFPRAAAIVTDVGAPLSHAAIVARELGIPAVVGCGNATIRLHTGDRVRVDGGQGTVEVLHEAPR